MSSEIARDHAALLELIEARMRAPLAWGKRANDCVSFQGAAILAQTGIDRMGGLPDWATERGAKRVLAKLGGLEAAVDGVLQPVPLALAMRGDVGLIEANRVRCLVTIEGETVIGPGVDGLVRHPRAALLRAWSAV